jgi:hypothetical protein
MDGSFERLSGVPIQPLAGRDQAQALDVFASTSLRGSGRGRVTGTIQNLAFPAETSFRQRNLPPRSSLFSQSRRLSQAPGRAFAAFHPITRALYSQTRAYREDGWPLVDLCAPCFGCAIHLMSQKKRRVRPGTRPSGHITEQGRKNQIASRLAYGVRANSPVLPLI